MPPAESPSAAPAPGDPEIPADAGPVPPPGTPLAPKSRVRPGTAPAGTADPAVVDVTGVPSAPAAAARAPSPRLTWVLQLLRQLDAASVAT